MLWGSGGSHTETLFEQPVLLYPMFRRGLLFIRGVLCK